MFVIKGLVLFTILGGARFPVISAIVRNIKNLISQRLIRDNAGTIIRCPKPFKFGMIGGQPTEYLLPLRHVVGTTDRG